MRTAGCVAHRALRMHFSDPANRLLEIGERRLVFSRGIYRSQPNIPRALHRLQQGGKPRLARAVRVFRHALHLGDLRQNLVAVARVRVTLCRGPRRKRRTRPRESCATAASRSPRSSVDRGFLDAHGSRGAASARAGRWRTRPSSRTEIPAAHRRCSPTSAVGSGRCSARASATRAPASAISPVDHRQLGLWARARASTSSGAGMAGVGTYPPARAAPMAAD